jgi:hypothetical protein
MSILEEDSPNDILFQQAVTEFLHIFTLQFGTSWIKSFHIKELEEKMWPLHSPDLTPHGFF